jgi:hypothetical protein
MPLSSEDNVSLIGLEVPSIIINLPSNEKVFIKSLTFELQAKPSKDEEIHQANMYLLKQ